MYNAFSRRNFENPQMIAAIVWLVPRFTQLRKCTAGNIVLSPKRLKKHEFKLKIFFSIFQKLEESSNVWKLFGWQFTIFFIAVIANRLHMQSN